MNATQMVECINCELARPGPGRVREGDGNSANGIMGGRSPPRFGGRRRCKTKMVAIGASLCSRILLVRMLPFGVLRPFLTQRRFSGREERRRRTDLCETSAG